jgi:hypothetical protein
MRPVTIGIQFCGGCNPRIDRGQIALELHKALVDMGMDVIFNTSDAEFTVFLSGCLSGCALKFNLKEPPLVEVAAATVDGVAMPVEGIVTEVLKKVSQFLE